MTTEAPAYLSRPALDVTLTPIGEQAFEAEGQSTRPISGYYRKPDGSITVGVTSEMEELHYRREGWETLPEYGHFDMTTEWMANHPFEALFMRGGAIEMPVAQVIEQGFHINAPVVPGCKKLIDQHHPRHKPTCWSLRYVVNFPQLEGSDAKAWECQFCAAVRPTKQGLNQHLEVMHKEERGELRTGQSLAEAIVRGLGAGGVPVAAVEPEEEDTSGDLAKAALNRLAKVGLNKGQREALAAMGIQFNDEPNTEADEDDTEA